MDSLKLNLLPSLEALLRHESVTRAADELGLSQSAMSYNLAQLRKLFVDELFIRNAGGLVTTPYARTLVEPLTAVLSDIEKLVARTSAFDPVQTVRSFMLAVPDASEVLLVPEVLNRLRVEAPGIQLLLRPVDEVDVLTDLNTGRLDMAVGIFTDGQVHHKRKLLHTDEYLCIYNGALLKLDDPISMDDYVSSPHVVLTGSKSQRDVVGEELAKVDQHRTVALATPHLLSIPFLVQKTPVIATIHANLARYFARMLGLRTSPPPLPLPTVPISLLWHSSNDAEPSHRWLRNLVASSVTEKVV